MAIFDGSGFEAIRQMQENMAARLANETKTDDKIKIISVYDNLVEGRNSKKIQKEELILSLQEEGMGETEIMSLIDELINDGIFQEVGTGYIAKA
jgi:N-acetyl-gamma-glutamylphosphate reductase